MLLYWMKGLSSRTKGRPGLITTRTEEKQGTKTYPLQSALCSGYLHMVQSKKASQSSRLARRRKLHIVRFVPMEQSSLIPLLLLFKMEAALPF